jgi:hypothetical protein
MTSEESGMTWEKLAHLAWYIVVGVQTGLYAGLHGNFLLRARAVALFAHDDEMASLFIEPNAEAKRIKMYATSMVRLGILKELAAQANPPLIEGLCEAMADSKFEAGTHQLMAAACEQVIKSRQEGETWDDAVRRTAVEFATTVGNNAFTAFNERLGIDQLFSTETVLEVGVKIMEKTSGASSLQ